MCLYSVYPTDHGFCTYNLVDYSVNSILNYCISTYYIRHSPTSPRTKANNIYNKHIYVECLCAFKKLFVNSFYLLHFVKLLPDFWPLFQPHNISVGLCMIFLTVTTTVLYSQQFYRNFFAAVGYNITPCEPCDDNSTDINNNERALKSSKNFETLLNRTVINVLLLEDNKDRCMVSRMIMRKYVCHPRHYPSSCT